MALVSLEQRRQRECADEQANKILQELAAYDLAHSTCPVDRRRLEKENERKALEAREVQEKQSAAQWWAALDARVVQIIQTYCWGEHIRRKPARCRVRCYWSSIRREPHGGRSR